MSLVPWSTYIEVCRLGSLSRAAHVLGYTQSAVSRQIASLEHDFGVTLLERLPRGVRPTREGDAFLRHARVVVSEVARARVSIEAAAGGSVAHLAVGGVPSAMADLLPRALAFAREKLPGHRITLQTAASSWLEARIRDGDLDVGVVTDYPPGLSRDRLLDRVLLLQDDVCVILPAEHRHADPDARRPLPLGLLADEVWAEDNAGSASLLVQAAAKAGFAPRLDLEVGDLTGKVAVVATGLAVALVPGLLIPALRPDVVARRLSDPPSRGIYAITRSDTRGDPGAAQAFVGLLHETATGS